MSDPIFIILFLAISIMYIYSTFEIKKRYTLEIEKIKTEKPDPKLLELLTKEKSFENINKVLDDLIEKVVNDYTLLALSRDNDNYLNSKQIETMENYVVESVKRNMSKTLIQLLGLIYKIDTDKDLHEVVKLKCKSYLIGFVSQYNADIVE